MYFILKLHKTYIVTYMYFLLKDNVIHYFQFLFQPKCSTFDALNHLTDKIREQLGNGNFACGVFIDFEKVFEMVD